MDAGETLQLGDVVDDGDNGSKFTPELTILTPVSYDLVELPNAKPFDKMDVDNHNVDFDSSSQTFYHNERTTFEKPGQKSLIRDRNTAKNEVEADSTTISFTEDDRSSATSRIKRKKQVRKMNDIVDANSPTEDDTPTATTPGKSRYGRVRKPKLSVDFVSVDRKSFAVLNSSSYDRIYLGETPNKVPAQRKKRKYCRRNNVAQMTDVDSSTTDTKESELPDVACSNVLESTELFSVPSCSIIGGDPEVDDSSRSSLNLGAIKTYSRRSDASGTSQNPGEKLCELNTGIVTQLNYPELNWKVGDVAWAKIGCYPYWPSIVTLEYGSSIYVKPVGKRMNRLAVHVQFFGDRGRRSWVLTTSLIKYDSKKQFIELKQKYKKLKDKIKLKYFFLQPRYSDLWDKAVSEADTILKLPHDERLQFYESIYPMSKEVYATEAANANRIKRPSARKRNPLERRGRKRKVLNEMDGRSVKQNNKSQMPVLPMSSIPGGGDSSADIKCQNSRTPIDEHTKKRRAFMRRMNRILKQSHTSAVTKRRLWSGPHSPSRIDPFNKLLKDSGGHRNLKPVNIDDQNDSRNSKNDLSVYDFESDDDTDVFIGTYNSRFMPQILTKIEAKEDDEPTVKRKSDVSVIDATKSRDARRHKIENKPDVSSKRMKKASMANVVRGLPVKLEEASSDDPSTIAALPKPIRNVGAKRSPTTLTGRLSARPRKGAAVIVKCVPKSIFLKTEDIGHDSGNEKAGTCDEAKDSCENRRNEDDARKLTVEKSKRGEKANPSFEGFRPKYIEKVMSEKQGLNDQEKEKLMTKSWNEREINQKTSRSKHQLALDNDLSSESDGCKSEEEKRRSSSLQAIRTRMKKSLMKIFAGLKAEKVCQLCEKPGVTVRCRGPCCGTYHVECALNSAAAEDETTCDTPSKRRNRPRAKPLFSLAGDIGDAATIKIKCVKDIDSENVDGEIENVSAKGTDEVAEVKEVRAQNDSAQLVVMEPAKPQDTEEAKLLSNRCGKVNEVIELPESVDWSNCGRGVVVVAATAAAAAVSNVFEKKVEVIQSPGSLVYGGDTVDENDAGATTRERGEVEMSSERMPKAPVKNQVQSDSGSVQLTVGLVDVTSCGAITFDLEISATNGYTVLPGNRMINFNREISLSDGKTEQNADDRMAEQSDASFDVSVRGRKASVLAAMNSAGESKVPNGPPILDEESASNLANLAAKETKDQPAVGNGLSPGPGLTAVTDGQTTTTDRLSTGPANSTDETEYYRATENESSPELTSLLADWTEDHLPSEKDFPTDPIPTKGQSFAKKKSTTKLTKLPEAEGTDKHLTVVLTNLANHAVPTDEQPCTTEEISSTNLATRPSVSTEDQPAGEKESSTDLMNLYKSTKELIVEEKELDTDGELTLEESAGQLGEITIGKADQLKSGVVSVATELEEAVSSDAASDIQSTSTKASSSNGVDFRCSRCIKNRMYPCFGCGQEIQDKTGETQRYNCYLASCGRVYHKECLKSWPQASWGGSAKETLRCPQHYCHTCISDNPASLKNKHCNEILVRCIQCPTAYHKRVHCIPAGTEMLTLSQIICPRHYEVSALRPVHLNTSWCFICCIGGSLICCDECPTSFHAECLKLRPEEYEGKKYVCDDCQTGRYLLYGEIAWVKLGHYRWWPARILFPNEVPENILNLPHRRGEFAVQFFGSHDYNWANRGRAFLYQEGDSGKKTCRRSSVDLAFEKAMLEAEEAYKMLKVDKAARDEEAKVGLKPPRYVRIKANKPVGNVRIVELNMSNMTACECDPTSERPCAPDSDCLNRMLLVECNPLVCPAGERCLNQAFEKRVYPPLMPYKTDKRGWGLKTLVDMKKGDFIIEYVGEMIDEEEYKRRVNIMHQRQEDNYYFLTIDKDRMLDAGPKGNVSRFMNHSCDPNCETQKWTVNGDTRVGLFASESIPANTELVFNYNLVTQNNEMKPCYCGSKKCSGFIGVKSTKNSNSSTDDETRKRSIEEPHKRSLDDASCAKSRKIIKCVRRKPSKRPRLAGAAAVTTVAPGIRLAIQRPNNLRSRTQPDVVRFKKRRPAEKLKLVEERTVDNVEERLTEPPITSQLVLGEVEKRSSQIEKGTTKMVEQPNKRRKRIMGKVEGRLSQETKIKSIPARRGRPADKFMHVKTTRGHFISKKIEALYKHREVFQSRVAQLATVKMDKAKREPRIERRGRKKAPRNEQEKQEILFQMIKKRIERKFEVMSALCSVDETCFVCGISGELLLCDNSNCPRGYHLQCVDKTKWPTGYWLCPWHYCNVCQSKKKLLKCSNCVSSFCHLHSEGNMFFKNGAYVCKKHKKAVVAENSKGSKTTEQTVVRSESTEEPASDQPSLEGTSEVDSASGRKLSSQSRQRAISSIFEADELRRSAQTRKNKTLSAQNASCNLLPLRKRKALRASVPEPPAKVRKFSVIRGANCTVKNAADSAKLVALPVKKRGRKPANASPHPLLESVGHSDEMIATERGPAMRKMVGKKRYIQDHLVNEFELARSNKIAVKASRTARKSVSIGARRSSRSERTENGDLKQPGSVRREVNCQTFGVVADERVRKDILDSMGSVPDTENEELSGKIDFYVNNNGEISDDEYINLEVEVINDDSN